MTTLTTSLPLARNKIENEPGHWILARVGKKVLRPGGRELTEKLLAALQIDAAQDVVEFAPGLGFTAQITLDRKPRSYTGIDADDSAIRLLQKNFSGTGARFVHADILKSKEKAGSASRIYGEAMLTMQTDRKKSEILREAHRLLRKGGLYGVHELGLTPDTIAHAEKAVIQKELSQAIKVNARPLTVSEWTQLFSENGFEVITVETNAMRLLDFGRMVSDEGFLRTLRIAFNILTNFKIAARVMSMRKCLNKYREHMNAVMIVARKK
ncbi:MAG: class I SAM-dependent methyltransferase [Spirochaetes bacterium]|nr:class I SAM-dependent methyltransferase [Spirochaetota bacterium]